MSTVYKSDYIIAARLGVDAADLHVEAQVTPGNVPVVCIMMTDALRGICRKALFRAERSISYDLPSTANSTCSVASLPSRSSTRITVVCFATCPVLTSYCDARVHTETSPTGIGRGVFRGARYRDA